MRRLIWATMLTMLLTLVPQLGSAQALKSLNETFPFVNGTFPTASGEALSLQEEGANQRPDVLEQFKSLRNTLIGLGTTGRGRRCVRRTAGPRYTRWFGISTPGTR